jgi:N-acetylmuramoyl-L-alanine amidase
MNKNLLSIFGFLLLFNFTTNAQQIGNSITEKVKVLLEQEKEHLPKTNLHLVADSFAINQQKLEIYFNTKQSFQQSSLPSDYLEMLPEILMPLSDQFNTQSILLFAKDAKTNEWKTLNFFSDLPQAAIYTPTINYEPHLPIKGNTNASTTSKVFPGGTGSPKPLGALAGKTVWLSPGHGWHNTGTSYTTQRGTTNGIVEDFTTIESVDYYLMHYLTNAGANVWSVRERDVNINEIVVDNDVPSSGYSETGSWSTGSAAGYGGTYRVATASATETATANFSPTVTQSGWYWVSVRCIAGTNRATDVPFTIIHSGDTSKVIVNQEVHSATWVHVGQYYFTADGLNKIILSNQSNEAGQAIIADAVRLGGGIGTKADCANPSPASGSNRPRYDESARQYAQFQGYPTCNEDVTVRPRFAEYEASKGVAGEINNSVFVSWHTNAGGGTGTESYIYDGLGSGRPNVTTGSLQLRNYIHNQLIADIRAGWKSTWTDRGVKVANFGEIRELNTMPGTLIELAFHDLAADATELKHPEFRRIAARAFYKGILKFFNNRDGSPLVFLPEEPTHVAATNNGNATIKLTWKAPSFGGILGNAATGYKVYISTTGKSFKDGISVTDTTYTFTGNPQTTYYFKISATNAGGESFTSSVVAARTPIASTTNIPYLIVDGFDRLDASALIQRNESAALGTVSRMILERMNRYDYMVEHAKALSACFNLAFDGCQNEAVIAGRVLLQNYIGVDWFCGEDAINDKSLDSTEKVLIKNYLNSGGKGLIISGAELGWDLGRAASPNADLDFYNNYLKANFVGDDANSYGFNGTTNFFNAQTGGFDNNLNGYYDVDSPDRIDVNGGSTIALTYSGGTSDGAAVGYKGAFNVLYLAFPFETITSASVREAIMCNAVAFTTPAIPLPIIGITLTGKNEVAKNVLSWQTKAEINVKYLAVERSENGIFFQQISNEILPKGNNNSGANYSYNDNLVLPSGYYRIKIVDVDGKFSFSNIVLLKSGKIGKVFNVITNPIVNNNLQLKIETNQSFSLRLTNSVGQIVYQNKYNSSIGKIISVSTNNFAKGMYTVQINTASEQQVEKLIIQ